MRVLFTHSYFYRLDSKHWKNHQPYPPLGTLIAASVARSMGFDVFFSDSSLQHGPEAIADSLAVETPDLVVIYDDGFNYLTKMCLTVMRDAAWKMSSMAHAAGSKVIVCSSDSTDTYQLYLDHDADYVVRGEGEETLASLLKVLREGGELAEVTGLAYVNGNNTVLTEHRPVLRNLDEVPMAAWDLVSLEDYRNIWIKHHGYFSLNIATTRGCPYKCNWCAKPIYGNRYHSRSPEHVVNEIEHLIKNYQPDHFWMCDDIFGLKPGWVQKLSTLVRER